MVILGLTLLLVIGVLFFKLMTYDVAMEWRTEGLLDSVRAKAMPQAYVVYPEGFRSINMPIGNAQSYAKIFGGTVHRLP